MNDCAAASARLIRVATSLTALMLAGLASLVVAPAASLAASVAGADVAADDDRDAIVGSGGLVLPAAAAEATRREVAGCRGCAWRLTSPCVEAPLGNSFEGQAACLSVTRGCQGGSLRRTWFRPTNQPWQDLGLMCMRDDPVTVESVGESVRQELVRHLPSLSVNRLPRTGIMTGLPTVFSSGQPAGVQRFDWRIAGRRVAVAASPTWEWRFPDGSSLTTGDPGRLDPQGTVRHVFRRAGPATVTCATRWTGEYTVDGLGPFPIPGSVTQEIAMAVPVGEGRALLTP